MENISNKTILPPKGSQNLYTYSRYSLTKSLSNVQKFLKMVNRYLARKSSLLLSVIRALEDCQLLSGLNIDFINSVSRTINSTSSLAVQQMDQLQTLLSALITNQQTCFDGLQAAASAWSVKNGLAVPLSNGTKLYSMSLSLFTRAWVPKKKKIKNHNVNMPASFPRPAMLGTLGGRRLLFHEVKTSKDGSLSLKKLSSNQNLFEEKIGRRLLQSSDAVMVSVT